MAWMKNCGKRKLNSLKVMLIPFGRRWKLLYVAWRP